MKVGLLLLLVVAGCQRDDGAEAAPRTTAREIVHDAGVLDAQLVDAASTTTVTASTPLACPPTTREKIGTWTNGLSKRALQMRWCEGPDGKKQGPFKRFDAKGLLAEEGVFSADVLDGPWTSFFPSGKPSESGNYVVGVQDGRWQKWWGSGQVADDHVLDHGKLVSTVHYNPQGRVVMRGGYRDDELDGEWNWFKDDGTPSKTVIYNRGKPTKAWRYEGTTRKVLPVDEIELYP